MPKPRFAEQLLVGLSSDLKRELHAEAERQGKTMSGLVRELVAAYITRKKRETT